MTTPPSRRGGYELADPHPNRSRLRQGLKTISLGVWFLFQLVFYAVGFVLYHAGLLLLRLSGFQHGAAAAPPISTDPPALSSPAPTPPLPRGGDDHDSSDSSSGKRPL